jgi:hypothetical protein
VHQRLGDRTQVARSVVDDGDVRHQGSGIRDQGSGKEKQRSSY